MAELVEAIYEHGLLRPLSPVNLKESERVLLSISTPNSSDTLDAMLDHGLVDYARAEVAQLIEIPSIEDVQRNLAGIEGSMAEFINSGRGDY